jgi:YteA family regulatory protein
MEKKIQEQFKQRLEAEKKRIAGMVKRIEETGIGDTMSYSVGELSAYDNHPADLGDVMFERSKDVALRDNENVLLTEIEFALHKIDDGSYGICDMCGQAITIDRLEAIPWGTLCITCQRKSDLEDPTPRPLEEAVLAPPFHRTFLDLDQEDSVGFDGEDALQAVLRYGSSDTPQDITGADDYENLWFNSDERQGIVDPADAIIAQRGLEHTTSSELAPDRKRR